MFRTIITCLTVLLLSYTPVCAQNSHASADGAKQFVHDIVGLTISIIKSNKLSQNQKEDKLSTLFSEKVDIDWIGRFVLGRYWRDANASQRSRYQKFYKQFLLMSYVPRFRDYTDEQVDLRNARLEGNNEYVVETQIVSKTTAQPIRVDYRLRYEKGTYKIFDIIAEGVSLIGVQRSEFGSIVAREGLDYLIDALKRKANSAA